MPIELMYEHERIRLERKFIKLRASYYSKRNEIVNNGDGGAGGGIEQFWLMCLKNNPALNTRQGQRRGVPQVSHEHSLRVPRGVLPPTRTLLAHCLHPRKR